jgi:predicted nucleic acid-binding Zn finger protein
MTLTVAITGFTASNWSQALNFDLLLPRRADSLDTLKTVTAHLQSVWVAPLADIAQATGLDTGACRAALQQACQQGLVTFDAAHQVYRYRPLTEQALDMSKFQFRQPAEKLAYDLLSRPKAISPLTLNLLPHEGVEISATITVKEDKREYLSQLKLNEEGQVSKASCSCHQIMQHGLSQGACSHLIALRLAYAEHQAKRDVTLITQETKLFIRRHKAQEEQIQLTLNNQRLLINREINQQAKQQQLAFNTVQAARQAYLGKIAQLETSGFIEG